MWSSSCHDTRADSPGAESPAGNPDPGRYINEHEEAAVWGFRLLLVSGTLAAVALLLTGMKDRFGRVPYLVSCLVLLVGLVTSATTFRVGHLGGLIRHSELKSAAIDGEIETDRR